MNFSFPFKRLIIEEGSKAHPFASRMIKRLDSIPDRSDSPPSVKEGGTQYDLQEPDKETLRLVSFPGEFLKPCPGTKEYLCCGYRILHLGTNCPFDCSYCILQTYFNQPSLRIFTNIEEKLNQIGNIIDERQGEVFRCGTGEFMDSLALEPIACWTHLLLPFFSKRRNAVLELKTKSDHIENLLSANDRQGIIVSWSLNSPYIIAREEHGTPSLKRRLMAAKRCQDEGYTLGFHFDPIVEHPGWREGYQKTVEMMAQVLDPNKIIWVSLGCFRYIPALKDIIRRRHPNSHILDGEFVMGLDGKMRYFKPIRMELYGYLNGLLRSWKADLGTYLCMESPEVWEMSLGWSPNGSEGLARFLDERVIRFFY